MSAADKKAKNQFTVVNCLVALGTFSNERIVTLVMADGKKVTAFVDKRDILVTREPKEGEEVPGKLFISVIESKGNKVLIDLPQATISNGTRLYVAKPTLEEVPA
jgi:hypothetical protein